MTWTSTYSERDDATFVESFKIWFYDPCVDNYLGISTQLEDVTYQVGSSVTTYTPAISTNVDTTTCPLTSSCWIYADDQDDWIDCYEYPSGPWTTKDSYATAFYFNFDTGNTGAYQVYSSINDYTTYVGAPYPNLDY